ncbi:BON domain-containing protein [Geomonas sp.]|uniref:BON domain-containing protein n=1 Tax=Geomonas sp. TaxID=2651584 RepID=UPI002B49A2C8|nr:BON domain-containing protein [Geomonas sp.]HJV34720.1 BON domain-containing protein [Geomonas sp.]
MKKLQRLLTIFLCFGLITTSAGLLGCSTTASHESTGQYVDDSVITSKVKAAIINDMALKGFQINVKTYQGVVQLSGFVDTPDNIRRAGELARNVKGVTDVKNDLTLK